MGVDVQELIDTNEKTVLNYAEHCHYNLPQGHILLTETLCAHKLEKAQLLLKEKDKEISLLKQQVEDLRIMLNLIKK